MFARFTRHFFVAVWHVKAAILVLIGFVGILFTGLMVAVLVFAVRESLEESRNRS